MIKLNFFLLLKQNLLNSFTLYKVDEDIFNLNLFDK